MLIDEDRFIEMAEAVSRIDERTLATASGVHDLTEGLGEVKTGPCACGRVHAKAIEDGEVDRRDLWAKVNGIPARLIAIIGVTVSVVGGIVGLIVVLK